MVLVPAQVTVAPHTPALQIWPFAHALPQPPQLAGSKLTNASQPSASLPLQLAKPALQAFTTQDELVQFDDALARLQTLPQAPQLLGSLVASVIEPAQMLSQVQVFWP